MTTVGNTVLRYSVRQSRVTDPAAEPKFGPGHSVTATSAGIRNSHRSEKSEENQNFWPRGAQGCVFHRFLDCFINYRVACTQMTPNSGLKWHPALL
jgi:hypothetical protein